MLNPPAASPASVLASECAARARARRGPPGCVGTWSPVQVSNARAVRLARRIESDVSAVTGLAFTVDGREVLSSGTDGTLRVGRGGSS
jgi:hypothetical protein